MIREGDQSMWNQRLFDAGHRDAAHTVAFAGLLAAFAEYRDIPAPHDVNEYECGYRAALEAHGIVFGSHGPAYMVPTDIGPVSDRVTWSELAQAVTFATFGGRLNTDTARCVR